MLCLEVLHQGLLLVITFTALLAVVGKICTATGFFIHVPRATCGKMFATLWTQIVGHDFVSLQVTSQCL